MNIFLEASRIALRVQTTNGPLSVEQLWTLSLPRLASAIKDAKKKLNVGDEDGLSFLEEKTTVNKVDQLTFDVLKEIYITKKTEQEEAKNRASVKEHNNKIMALIHQKQEASLGDKSIEELTAMLK